MTIKQESVFIKLAESQTLHLRRIGKTDAKGPAVFLHGLLKMAKSLHPQQ